MRSCENMNNLEKIYGLYFREQSNKSVHERVHTGSKPFSENNCDSKKITATVRKYTFDLGNNLRRVFMREFTQALNHSHVRYATNHSEQQHSEGCTYSDIPR